MSPEGFLINDIGFLVELRDSIGTVYARFLITSKNSLTVQIIPGEKTNVRSNSDPRYLRSTLSDQRTVRA